MLFNLVFFVVLFLVFYFLYSFIFDDMLKKEKYTKINELVFLTSYFKLDKKKMNYRQCLNGVAILNSFIISFTVVLVNVIKINIMFVLMIAFLIMLILIYAGYMLYGKHCQKKWGKKDGV